MKATLSLLLLLSSLGTAMAAVSTADRTLLFNDDFDTLSVSQSGKDTQWNYIDYVGWDNVNANNWRTYQSNDPSLSEIRSDGDTSFVTLWGKKGDYHTENTSTSNATATVGNNVYACGGLFTDKTFTFQYGYVEARARFDSVQGCWPAIWLLPANGANWPANGEIDILEHINDNTVAHQTLHFLNNNNVYGSGVGTTGSIAGAVNDWHTYGMEWTENAISFYIDGNKTTTITGDLYKNWPFGRENNEFYLLIDQQIGGSWPGMPDAAADATLSSTGAALDIDYIRVYSAESTDSNVWKNGSTAAWEAGTELADTRAWQNGSNMNFSGTTGEIAVGDVSVSHLNVKDDAKVSLKGGTIHAGELTLSGDATATAAGPGTHLSISGELDVETLHTAANKWMSTVHLTVEDGGSATIGTVQGEMVDGKVGQAFFSAQGEGALTIGTLNSAGGVVNINAGAADTGRVSITGDAKFYQIFLSNGELELHSGSITMNNGGKIELKGGTLLWDGELNDSKLVYNGGAVRLTNTPTGDIALTGSQKLEMDTLGTQHTTLAAGTTLSTTQDWALDKNTSLSGAGTLEIASGTVTLNKVLTNDTMAAGIHVKDGAKLAVIAKNANGNYNGTVTIDKGGEMSISEHTAAGGIVPVVGSTGSIVNNGLVVVDESNSSAGPKWLNGMSGTGTVKVECADVRMASTKAEFTGSVEVSEGGSVRIAGAATNFDTLTVTDGSMEIVTSATLSAKELHLDAAGTLNATFNAQEATLSVSALAEAVNGSHLNADLVLEGGAVFNIIGSGAEGDGLIMGSSITLNGTEKIIIGSDVVTALIDMADSYVLATSMDGFYTDGLTLSWADGETRSAADYLALSAADTGKLNLADYHLSYTGSTGNGTLSLVHVTPEPATATLSLLALAALVARRRR